MSDDVDNAQRITEFYTEQAIKASQRNVSKAIPIGTCNWCDTPVSGMIRWCCGACRDEWEKENR
ncbi:hypothetical protein UFOVP1367_15 [uncultured Caudovirales phage]|uniref:Uncharacterized protein n=1 Tax=uncultured Caudovirales phage TaxID=2100421 RepID=A0A6J5RVD5_9CAUD|nr:DksA-like zinc-finger protein [uncultured Caudovirales phage]CAB4202433.1 hypothetical protein UFOVP1367_15 [uncultured Caudovirales phage]